MLLNIPYTDITPTRCWCWFCRYMTTKQVAACRHIVLAYLAGYCWAPRPARAAVRWVLHVALIHRWYVARGGATALRPAIVVAAARPACAARSAAGRGGASHPGARRGEPLPGARLALRRSKPRDARRA